MSNQVCIVLCTQREKKSKIKQFGSTVFKYQTLADSEGKFTNS